MRAQFETTGMKAKAAAAHTKAAVYCPICTHTVEAEVSGHGRHSAVVKGQKCSRCNGSLDAGVILAPARAA